MDALVSEGISSAMPTPVPAVGFCVIVIGVGQEDDEFTPTRLLRSI